MYREKIREYYDHLSRSYRRVADYIMSNYYEVSFMTAAQLANAVGVDTTTVVRFSQRVGYNGYPELLQDIREQVRTEIYAAYLPKRIMPEDPSGIFKECIEQEKQNLTQMQVHSPPEHIAEVAAMLLKAKHIVVMAEGYAETVAPVVVGQLRHCGLSAEAVSSDPVQRAGALLNLTQETVIIGVGADEQGRDVARAMLFARSKGCVTIGVVGSLDSPINRMADRVIFAPTKACGAIPSIVSLITALTALVLIISKDHGRTVEKQSEEFAAIYQFLIEPETEAPEDDSDAAGKGA